jgi:arylsulfatase
MTRSLLLAAGALLVSPALADEPTKRPNVIIVLADDQGYGDFSCHGNPVLKTPNLDKLHSQSIRFTDFHVAPMCSPTRGQLMTGQDALRNGACSVCAGRSMIRHGIPTMAEIFAANGYRTGHIGKWHLGDSYPNLPHQRGFQDSVYHLGWGITSMADLWQNDYFDPHFRHNGELKQYKGYCTDVLFDLALVWMKEQKGKGEPFFVYLPTNAPHGPLWVPDKYRKLYAGKVGPNVASFFGMIANIDDNMARLDQFLSDNGLIDNTIIIYMNDNGGTAGVDTYNSGMRGRKTMYYEGGHRAACFLRWPAGKLGTPRDLDVLSHIQDLLPTLIDLCDLKPTKKADFDGASLVTLLRGAVKKNPDRMLVVQYGQKPEKWDCCVMWDKWRLVKGEELYDLRTDPGQKTNIADKHADVVKKMRDHYEAWWKQIAPLVDDFVPVVIGSEKENPVTLSAADWANVYCDNMFNLRAGLDRNAPWHVVAERDGEYEIALRRWPKEADAAITAAVPAFKAVDGMLPAGKAMPVAKMRLKIADFDETKPVGADAKAVVFTVNLKAGTKMTMQSWMYDADGKELAGAYFADVRRKSAK